jgi:hypothetical protein
VKELGSVSRKLEKVTTQISSIHDRLPATTRATSLSLLRFQGVEPKPLEDSGDGGT